MEGPFWVKHEKNCCYAADFLILACSCLTGETQAFVFLNHKKPIAAMVIAATAAAGFMLCRAAQVAEKTNDPVTSENSSRTAPMVMVFLLVLSSLNLVNGRFF